MLRDSDLILDNQRSLKIPALEFPIAKTRSRDLAILNFTTGSTGPAKAVEASYGMLRATVHLIQKSFHQTTADIDMVTVPFFGIVSLILGSTVVIPPMNPAKPGDVDPEKIIGVIQTYQVTTMLASPALFAKVGPYAVQNNIKLSSLRNVNSGGAPIRIPVLKTLASILDEKSETYSSWGATEGLPLATISGRDILGKFQPLIASGRGSPIGRILPGIQARLIKVTDDNIPSWDESLRVEADKIGEIIVHGANVSQSYHMNPKADAAHKITERRLEDEIIWHRTGDLAWQDPDGVLFFCGRKAHAFESSTGLTMHSVACEGVTNTHREVKHSALVGVKGTPVMCIELLEKTSAAHREEIRRNCLALLAANPATHEITTILFHRRFPVDLRHNAKIERPKLQIWAEHQLLPQSQLGFYAKIVPIVGWLYIALGFAVDLPAGFWTYLWWIDLFLSVVVHLAQIPEGITVGAFHGYTARESALRTFILGATWWKPLRPKTKG